MILHARINSDLKTALLEGDRLKADTLRGLKAVILNEEVALGKREVGLEDPAVEQLIVKEVKKRNESAKIYQEAGREELADSELKEAEILSVYLPKQLTEDEIRAVVIRAIKELGASGNSAMGQVIGTVKKELGNSADGAIVAKIVKEELDKQGV